MVVFAAWEGTDFSWGWKGSGRRFKCFGFSLLLGDFLCMFSVMRDRYTQ